MAVKRSTLGATEFLVGTDERRPLRAPAVGPGFELENDQVRLAVFHFIQRRRFFGIRLDVRELVVVEDRRHVERLPTCCGRLSLRSFAT